MSNEKSANQYRELVLPGLSYFSIGVLISLGFALIVLPFGALVAEIVGFGSLILWVVLAFTSAKSIKIDDQTLEVGKASISRNLVGAVHLIDKGESRIERGPKLSALAFVQFQFGIQTLVKVEITDEKDPTPYWLFTTRQPELIKEILTKN